MPKTIAIKLTPKASANRIGEMRIMPGGVEALTVYVTAPPEKNKANEAALRILAEYLNLPISKLSIIKGQASRNKLVKIDE